MFGLNDNDNANQASASNASGLPPLNTSVSDLRSSNPTVDKALNSAPPPPHAPLGGKPSIPTLAVPGADSIGDSENPYASTDPPQPYAGTSTALTPSSPPVAASLANGSNEDELLKIKQQALQNLTPLVDHLDQTDEEKFKTTMMLIQASDNSDLISEAYQAANKITDQKVRAQALLDVVNEINYFTQQHQAEDKKV